jgi:fucose 4-O-acetylase-like acetyltransferase
MKDTITSPKTRYLWIDLAKALSISLVVYRHIPPNAYDLTSSLPLFFFMAGLLFNFEKHPSFIEFVKHRSKQLLVPYFAFFILFYLFWLFVGQGMSSPEEQAMPFYAPLLEYLYGRPNLICMPLWFLACLFAMQCLFYLFKKINRTVSFIVLLLLPFVPLVIDMSNAPWMLDNVCLYFPYYGMASLFRKEIFLLMENSRRYIYALMALFIYVMSVFLQANISDDFLRTAVTIVQDFSFFLPVLVLMQMLTNKFGLHSSIKFMVTNAVIVLACHPYIIRLSDIFVVKVLNETAAFYEGNLLFKIGLTVFIMLIMPVPIYIINRYFPFIVGKGKLFREKN